MGIFAKILKIKRILKARCCNYILEQMQAALCVRRKRFAVKFDENCLNKAGKARNVANKSKVASDERIG